MSRQHTSTTQHTNVIRDVRSLTPSYAVNDYQARSITERQAFKALELLGIVDAPVPVALLAELPRIQVVVRTSDQLREACGHNVSGHSQWASGRWHIAVNRDDSPTRRRFTLAHEFKHVLDHPFMRVLYTDRYGRTDAQRVEDICDYFAACLLMPRPWVKHAWTQLTQDQTRLAAYFRVSPAAMARRLHDLGLSEPRPRHWGQESIARYFRAGSVHAPVIA